MKRTIAYIDDNLDSCYLIEALLEDYYSTKTFQSGDDGLRYLRQERPDAILLDITLPGLTGLQVLREIRRDPSLQEIPVVAFTAHAMKGDREKYLDLGFDGYLSKPILDETLLLGTIERAIESRRRPSSS